MRVNHPTTLIKATITQNMHHMMQELSEIKNKIKLTHLEEAYAIHINATQNKMHSIKMHLEKFYLMQVKKSSGVLGYIGKFLFGSNDLEDQLHNVREIEEGFEKHTTNTIELLNEKWKKNATVVQIRIRKGRKKQHMVQQTR
jgi:hypothetical protein